MSETRTPILENEIQDHIDAVEVKSNSAYVLIRKIFDIVISALLLVILAVPTAILGVVPNRKLHKAKTNILHRLMDALKGKRSIFGQNIENKENCTENGEEAKKTGLKILVVCQHYWPEPYRLPDLCEKLVKRGHEVWVITDVPNYPTGKIYPGYERRQNREEVHNGVHIIRTFTIERRNNLFFRFLNYYSFAISSKIRAKRMPPDFDVVLAYQSSPVMMASGAMAYAKKFGKKVVLYCLDLWPASLCVGGIKPKSFVYNVFGKISKRIYRQADKILVSSRGFEKYLTTYSGICESRICYLPQYADKQYLKSFNKEQDKCFNLVFAGNVGTAQNMTEIMDAAGILSNEHDIIWHIVGDGSQLEKCKEYAAKRELYNVVFHGYKSGEELDACYKMADAMLISLIDDPIISLTLPLKLLTYLAAGKPIIASASGEIAKIISEADCGYTVPPGGAEKLAEAVLAMANNANLTRFGENARNYYYSNFSEENYLDKIEYTLKQFGGIEYAEDESTYDKRSLRHS